MPWVMLDDGFADHPKIVGLSDAALRAAVRAMCYAARHRTDGRIPAAVVQTLASPKVRRELEGAAVWDVNGTSDVYIHDWLDYNISRAADDELRAKRAKAGRASGQSRRGKPDT